MARNVHAENIGLLPQIIYKVYGAFVEALKATGVLNADERVCVSSIPIRA
jgi:hypothetical protein